MERSFETEFCGWLNAAEWRALFQRWLEGYDVPGRSQDEDAFEALLSALPRGAEEDRASRILAERTGLLISEAVTQSPAVRVLERYWFNLLSLGACLSYPDALSAPLRQVLESGVLAKPDGSLDWRGAPLENVLWSALATNQADPGLRKFWFRLIEPKKLDRAYAGFRGIVRLPKSASELGEPDLEAIAQALSSMAHLFEEDDKRRDEFRALLRHIEEFHGRTWAQRLRKSVLTDLAEKFEWPLWAIETLPSLVLEVPNMPDRLWIWEYIAGNLDPDVKRRFGIEVEQAHLCRNALVRVKVERGPQDLRTALSEIEKARANNPYSSDESARDVSSEVGAGVLPRRRRPQRSSSPGPAVP